MVRCVSVCCDMFRYVMSGSVRARRSWFGSVSSGGACCVRAVELSYGSFSCVMDWYGQSVESRSVEVRSVMLSSGLLRRGGRVRVRCCREWLGVLSRSW